MNFSYNMNQAHKNTDQSDNISGTTSTSTSAHRRRSRILSSNLDACHSILQNDDESERAAIRRRSVSSSHALSCVSETSSRLSLSIANEIIQMLPIQVQAGIAQYVKMNSENRINIKNAFDLQIIDFMSYMVRKPNHAMESFVVATSALDISAKVYSLRVDLLHHEVIKIADDLGMQQASTTQEDDVVNNENTNSGNNDSNPDEQTNNMRLQNKRKKNKKSSLRVRTVETLWGEIDEAILAPSTIFDGDTQTTDMLFQVIMVQHCNQGLQINMYKDIIDDNYNMIEDSENSLKIKWPIKKIDDRLVIDPQFSEFEFLGWPKDADFSDLLSVSSIINNESDANLMLDDRFVFDLDASIPTEGEIFHSNAPCDEALDVDEYEIRNENAPANKPSEYIVDVRNSDGLIDIMGHGGCEYSFFSGPIDIVYVGPSYWKVKFNRRRQDDNREDGCVNLLSRRGRKKEIDIIFNDDSINIANEILSVKTNGKLSFRTWTEENITLLNQFSQHVIENYKKFHLRPEDVIEFPVERLIKGTVISEKIDRFSNKNNDSDNNNNINLSAEDVQSSFDSHAFEPEFQNSIDENVSAQLTDELGFISGNLVEIPKITPYIKILHIQQPKRINIRKLKATMWTQLQAMYKDINKHNHYNGDNIEKNQLGNDLLSNYEPVKFSQLYTKLLVLLSTKDAKELSFAFAYTALLQLVSEKNLQLSHVEDFHDINVFLPQIAMDN